MKLKINRNKNKFNNSIMSRIVSSKFKTSIIIMDIDSNIIHIYW